MYYICNIAEYAQKGKGYLSKKHDKHMNVLFTVFYPYTIIPYAIT